MCNGLCVLQFNIRLMFAIMDGAIVNDQHSGGIFQFFADLATYVAGVQSAVSTQGVI